MEEFEVKILEINVDITIDILYNKARYEGSHFLKAIFFDPPDKKKNKADVIRIRTITPIDNPKRQTTILTVKGPKNSVGKFAKHRTEYEALIGSVENGISDFEAISRIMAQLGYKQLPCTNEKLRINFKKKNAHFVIDIWPKNIIPPLLELEADSEKKIKDALSLLNIHKRDTTSFDMKELMEYYKVPVNKNILFSGIEKSRLIKKFGRILK